ncbi:ATPase [Ruminococcus albus]|uniref:ATPase n=1 Tax=Ruminococcus albus TaxID=1264 RepID=A0A1H7MK05_RUMAL|nr:ATPase [Ruminococcus albus]SEL11494.1 hypothetical protein SAMN05216469_11218 [Ruminococcus albus]
MSEKYFLGCMTQQGFSTEFGRLMEENDRFTYILKGGAGTGKSSLMKRIADEFEKSGHVVRFYCSSDPASLDAVMLENEGVLIVDGTSPHVFDPAYPAVRQKIVDLGQFWDAEKLMAFKDEIIEVTDKNKSQLARAKRFSAALSNVCNDSFSCSRGCIDEEKLEAFLMRFYKKILPRKGSGTGRQDIRQLSVLTEYGCMTQTETIGCYIEKYLLHDDDFACAHLICEKTAAEAVRRGFDVILCPCHGLNNTAYEHLLIPELGLALISSTPLNKLVPEGCAKINLSRFYDRSAITRYRSRLKMNRLTMASLADEVYETIKSAKVVHDDIEKYYIAAMDFESLDKLAEELIAEIKRR